MTHDWGEALRKLVQQCCENHDRMLEEALVWANLEGIGVRLEDNQEVDFANDTYKIVTTATRDPDVPAGEVWEKTNYGHTTVYGRKPEQV